MKTFRVLYIANNEVDEGAIRIQAYDRYEAARKAKPILQTDEHTNDIVITDVVELSEAR